MTGGASLAHPPRRQFAGITGASARHIKEVHVPRPIKPETVQKLKDKLTDEKTKSSNLKEALRISKADLKTLTGRLKTANRILAKSGHPAV